MSAPFTKLRFHVALYSTYLDLLRGKFTEIPKSQIDQAGHLAERLRVFFWTPTVTPGAKLIVQNVLPDLQRTVCELRLDWDITDGPTVPSEPVDWLICFKAVPRDLKSGQHRSVMLICDQGDVYWDELKRFDAVVATSSHPFARVVGTRHPHVSFISESEPSRYLDFGRENLAKAPMVGRNVLLWHGGKYSQDALNSLRPVLIRWAKSQDAHLHIVGGQNPSSFERWGTLRVSRFPWSENQLLRSAAAARLAILPARSSLKNSWLKPASRIRCMMALGVPAIGDGRVPDATDFMRRCGGPLASSLKEWEEKVLSLWNDPEELVQLAKRGHAAVASEFSTEQTARQWIRYLGDAIALHATSDNTGKWRSVAVR
jgi:glycosyltransferase involved in cell wall biosynthesis